MRHNGLEGWEEPEDGERSHKVSSDRELSRILVLGQASLWLCQARFMSSDTSATQNTSAFFYPKEKS